MWLSIILSSHSVLRSVFMHISISKKTTVNSYKAANSVSHLQDSWETVTRLSACKHSHWCNWQDQDRSKPHPVALLNQRAAGTITQYEHWDQPRCEHQLQLSRIPFSELLWQQFSWDISKAHQFYSTDLVFMVPGCKHTLRPQGLLQTCQDCGHTQQPQTHTWNQSDTPPAVRVLQKVCRAY